MLAVIAAVLALAGAPSDTRVVCEPSLPVGGITYYTLSPPSIQLSPIACAAILLAAASASERVAIARLNPTANIDRILGIGLLIDLHEAEHAALRSGDETLVQCAALAKLPTLLARLTPHPDASARWAATSDATLPPEYHTHPC